MSAAHGPDRLEAILPLFLGLFVFLRAREALRFLPAFSAFLNVISAFVMSHKPDLRPLLEREQKQLTEMSRPAFANATSWQARPVKTAKGRNATP